MRKIIKVLSHQDRIYGRIISGGSQISKDEEGMMLAEEIEKGFFEKKSVNISNYAVTCPLYIPFNLFNAFRSTPLN